MSSKLSQKAERLVVTHPVKELLFDGYGVKPYEELGIEHNGAMSESGGDFMVPEFLMDGKYGLYENVLGFNKNAFINVHQLTLSNFLEKLYG